MDDEEGIRELACTMLKGVGYEAAAAKNGHETIRAHQKAIAEGHPFDVVIMDLTIWGGMGGKEVVQKLKQMDPRVKAIASSGYSTDITVANSKQHGFLGIVTKPYSPEELTRIIHQVIDDDDWQLVLA